MHRSPVWWIPLHLCISAGTFKSWLLRFCFIVPASTALISRLSRRRWGCRPPWFLLCCFVIWPQRWSSMTSTRWSSARTPCTWGPRRGGSPTPRWRRSASFMPTNLDMWPCTILTTGSQFIQRTPSRKLRGTGVWITPGCMSHRLVRNRKRLFYFSLLMFKKKHQSYWKRSIEIKKKSFPLNCNLKIWIWGKIS